MRPELFGSLKFKVQKHLYYRRTRDVRCQTKYEEELRSLFQDGVLVLPELISSSVVKAINNEIRPTMEDLSLARYKGTLKSFRFEDYGVYRLCNIDELSPTSRLFFEHDMVVDLAKAFVSKDVVSYQRMAELKPSIGYSSVADNWHFDDWKHRFKAFLYLNDVTEDEAPFVYLRGSHNSIAPWRERKEREYHVYGKSKGAYGYFTPDEVAYIIQRYKHEVIKCNGKAGTVIICDTRGLHRGSVLRKNQRLMLANYFGIRDIK